MDKSYNSGLNVSSHPLSQQFQFMSKQADNDAPFDPKQILHQISTQQDISIPQLQSEMKELKLTLNQLVLQMGRVKKDITARPTVNKLMENTILVTSMIQVDPNIMKLLKSKEDQVKNHKSSEKQQNLQEKTPSDQLKDLSCKLGSKLSNFNQGLSVLYSMFKQLQKHSQTDISQLRSFLEQKTHSIQDQINLMKFQQISQRNSLIQKVQAQYQSTQQKLRIIQTKNAWQIKQLKTKLHQKLDKSIFQKAIEQTLQQSKKMFKDFCQSSSQLINPEKIKQLQQTIKENKLKFIKDITECHLKVDSTDARMTKQLVALEFYKKQRTSIEKRLSSINLNFSQIHEKVTFLIKDSLNHQNRLKKQQNQMQQKTKAMKQMRATLRSLSITQQFQQMLSQIDPQKILSFENKISSLEIQNKQVYKMFSHVNEQIDKINSKFDISGVLIPNKSRQKDYELNDLREIIDEYFVQNRFANKISKLQSEITQGKATVEAIKFMQKKVARLQKQSDYSKIIQQFNLLQERLSKQVKIISQKLQTRISQAEVQRSYIQGLVSSTTKNDNINGSSSHEQLRRKLLMSESRSRIMDINSNFQRSNSMRKISLWQGGNNNIVSAKQALSSSRFGKNTISSARKSLLTSNNLLLGS